MVNRFSLFACVLAGALLVPTLSWAADDNTTENSRTEYQTVIGRIAFKSTAKPDLFRIPSVIRLDEDHVIAFADQRPNGNFDMGPKCTNSIVYKLGTKTNNTWNFGTQQTLIANRDNAAASDAATVLDRASGKKILVISTYGKTAYGNGKTQMARRYMTYDKTTHELTPVVEGKYVDGSTAIDFEFSNSIYKLFGNDKAAVNTAFFSSGEICQSRIVKKGEYYRLYAALCTRPNGTKVIYSDDFGKTWNVLNDAADCPAPKGDESKIVELPDGRLLLSTRMYNGNNSDVHGRWFNVFTYSDTEYSKGYWEAPQNSDYSTSKSYKKDDQSSSWLLGAGAVNGAVAFVPAVNKTTNEQVYIALQSMPARVNKGVTNDPGTDNLAIYWKVFKSPSHYTHVAYSGARNTAENPQGITTFDPKLMTKMGDPEEFLYGWTKYSLNDATKYGMACETRYSAMVDNGVDGVDLLSEEYRTPDGCNDIVYRQISLSDITGNAYDYQKENNETRTAYLAKSNSTSEDPLPGNVYTIKVRWKYKDSDGVEKTKERYLTASNLTHFYDNSTTDDLKLEEKNPTDAVDENFLWTLQCDPDASTRGNSGIYQPFFYISSFSGVGYIGKDYGWNYTSSGYQKGARANLSPKMNNELKVLELHSQWAEPNYDTSNKSKVGDGNTLVIQTQEQGSRGALAFCLETGEANWLNYSTQNANRYNDVQIKNNEDNSLNKDHIKQKGQHWSTDLIFTRLTQSSTTSTGYPYGTFENPTYPGDPTKEIYLVRSNDGKARRKDDGYEDYDYYGTIRLPYAVKLEDGVEAYAVSSNNGLLTKDGYDVAVNMTKLDLTDNVLPRETPVVLRYKNTGGVNGDRQGTDLTKKIKLVPTAAQKPQTTYFNGTLGEMWFYDLNAKKDTYSAESGDSDGKFYYILGKKNGRVAFYGLGPSTREDESKGKYVVPANKAYFILSISKSKPVSLDFAFEGEDATGITTINAVSTANGKVYDLNGRYVGDSLDNLAPGLYIQNGRKVVKQ